MITFVHLVAEAGVRSAADRRGAEGRGDAGELAEEGTDGGALWHRR